jgi:hypothetical protein
MPKDKDAVVRLIHQIVSSATPPAFAPNFARPREIPAAKFWSPGAESEDGPLRLVVTRPTKRAGNRLRLPRGENFGLAWWGLTRRAKASVHQRLAAGLPQSSTRAHIENQHAQIDRIADENLIRESKQDNRCGWGVSLPKE